MKLKREYSAELPIRQTPRDFVAMTRLFPLSRRRALTFAGVDDGQPLGATGSHRSAPTASSIASCRPA